MTDPLPPEIQVSETPGGVHYRLPQRQLGGVRFVGLGVMLVAGTVGALAAARVIVVGTASLRQAGLDDELSLALSGLLALLLLGCAFAAVRFGAFAFLGHSEIALRDGHLSATERAGPFYRTRHKPLPCVVRLTVASVVNVLGMRPRKQAAFAALSTLWDLRADSERDQPLWLAINYPRDLLLPLAKALARRCQLDAEPSAQGEPAPLPVVEEKMPPPVA